MPFYIASANICSSLANRAAEMAPKKKGKGKGDKLARMSVEQRQQYLDRRAAQEAESNRRKEELVAGFLKVTVTVAIR